MKEKGKVKKKIVVLKMWTKRIVDNSGQHTDCPPLHAKRWCYWTEKVIIIVDWKYFKHKAL